MYEEIISAYSPADSIGNYYGESLQSLQFANLENPKLYLGLKKFHMIYLRTENDIMRVVSRDYGWAIESSPSNRFCSIISITYIQCMSAQVGHCFRYSSADLTSGPVREIYGFYGEVRDSEPVGRILTPIIPDFESL